MAAIVAILKIYFEPLLSKLHWKYQVDLFNLQPWGKKWPHSGVTCMVHRWGIQGHLDILVLLWLVDPVYHSNALAYVTRDVWLDNVKNLQRYILRYTVANPTSSRNIASWLAFGFTQLTTLVVLCKYYIFSKEKMNKCIRMGIIASNLSFGEVNRRFYGSKLSFTAPLTCCRKTKFQTVKPPIYLPKCQIWMQLSPNCDHLVVAEGTGCFGFLWSVTGVLFFLSLGVIGRLWPEIMAI